MTLLHGRRHGRGSGIAWSIGLATLVLALAPAAAGAANRFAEVGGNGPEPCAAGDPCSIENAVNNAVSGDDVTLLGGLPPNPYSTSTDMTAVPGVSVHGTLGARPVIETTAQFPLTVTGATLRDVVVEHDGNNGSAVFSNGSGALLERVSAHSFGIAQSPCVIGAGDTIRDSTCWFTGFDLTSDSAALKVFAPFAGGGAATVRNVTAVSSGTSAGLWAAAFDGSSTVNATNVIALSGTGPDVRTFQFPGFTGAHSIVLDHSNYDSEQEASAGQITDAGTGDGNQTTPPVFVDAANGDFHQQATSTGTIDLGTATGLLPGELDFEAQARNQGAAPDIGADELAVAPPSGGGGGGTTPGTTAPPATPTTTTTPAPTGQRAAALKKCKKKRSARARRNCRKRANKLPV